MDELLDKDCKTTLLKVLKELKEDVEKVNIIIYEQSGNINKWKENLKKNYKEILKQKGIIIEIKN